MALFTDSIDLIEDLPLLVRHSELFSRLDGPSQLARPHLQVRQPVLVNEIPQSMGELTTRDREEVYREEYFYFMTILFGKMKIKEGLMK